MLGSLAVVLGLAIISWQLTFGLNGDVRYVLGGLRVHGSDQLLGFVRTFTHRPLAYRAAMSAAADSLAIVGLDADTPAFEITLRLLAWLLSLAAGTAIWAGLRKRIDSGQALAIGIAAAASLSFAPNFDFLQPEWLATIFVAFGVAGALSIRNTTAAAAVAGSSLAVAVALKLGTLPLAPLGIVLIAVFDRRRAVFAGVAGLIAGVGWVILSHSLPLEWQWLHDMALLDPNSTLRSLPSWGDLLQTMMVVGSKAAVSPIVVLAPASVALLVRLGPSGGHRRWLGIALVVCLALTAIPVIVQGQGLLYHAAALPVFASVLAAGAAVRWWQATARVPLIFALTIPPLSLAAVLVLSAPQKWRETNAGIVMILLAITAATFLVIALCISIVHARRPHQDDRLRTRHSSVATLAAVILLVALLPASAPSAAWALEPIQTPYTNEGWRTQSAAVDAQLHQLALQIGPTTPVLYFAYGDVAYHMGNPTPCKYPSPLFLQRTAFFSYATELPSYHDNLLCLEKSPVDFLILQPPWMRLTSLSTIIRGLVKRRFDCSRALKIGNVQACPAR